MGVVCECDDPTETEAYREQFGITFPIHLDTEFRLAEALDATVTLEAVLVDRDRSIRFKWLSIMSICTLILRFVTGFREIVNERPMLDPERRHGLWFVAHVVAKVAALAVVGFARGTSRAEDCTAVIVKRIVPAR